MNNNFDKYLKDDFFNVEEYNRKNKPLIYLGTPYSHPDKNIQKERFDKVNRAAGFLMRKGYIVFSPISHSHSIAEVADLPTNWEFWKKHDEIYLSLCHKMIVLMQDGWRESKGVTAEIKIAEELGIPVEFMEYKENYE